MRESGQLSISPHILTFLTGPILDKELRVCSRRKRYYALRSIYLIVMAALVSIVWLSRNSSLGWQNSVYSTSRMAEVGRTIIIAVTWFQFIITQIIAILFFSSAICDEISRGTLNVLMTTPITSIQIVLGKLLSKLILLVLTLSLSLSTLSIIYIFGGMHWEYIISSFSITLTAVLFTSALTLFFSGRFKRPHTVIILAITVLSIFYTMGPPLIQMLSTASGRGAWLLAFNPMAAMIEISYPQISGAVGTGPAFSWGLHCAFMTGVSGILVALTVIGLRKSILTFAFERHQKRGLWIRWKNFIVGRPGYYPLQLSNLGKSRTARTLREWILFILLLMAFVGGYTVLFSNQGSITESIFGTLTGTVWLIVYIRTMIAASTAITKEKENKTLTALLCCPLKNKQIIMGKAKQVLRSNYVGWAVLTVNAASSYILLSLSNNSGAVVFGPGNVIMLSFLSVLSTIGSAVFIICFGLYLSVRLKSSTAAVVTGLIGYLVWYYLRYMFIVVPLLIGAMFGMYMLSYYVLPFLDIGVGLFLLWRANCSLRRFAFNH